MSACLTAIHPEEEEKSHEQTDTQTRSVANCNEGPRHGSARFGKAGCRRASCAATVFVTEFTMGVSLRREGTDARAGPRYEWVGALPVAPGLREERWGHIRADRARGKDVRDPACMWGT